MPFNLPQLRKLGCTCPALYYCAPRRPMMMGRVVVATIRALCPHIFGAVCLWECPPLLGMVGFTLHGT